MQRFQRRRQRDACQPLSDKGAAPYVNQAFGESYAFELAVRSRKRSVVSFIGNGIISAFFVPLDVFYRSAVKHNLRQIFAAAESCGGQPFQIRFYCYAQKRRIVQTVRNTGSRMNPNASEKQRRVAYCGNLSGYDDVRQSKARPNQRTILIRQHGAVGQ